ncbi:MAG: glycosyltransferase, partial [Anaerolineae bacterium]|nr:glycosyltransferase [Anaerolineae bacterium]NIQ81088.1 glycosyltransferase [Anaerolineae bacterium]
LPLVIAGIWDARYPEAKQQAESFDLGNAIRFVGSVPAADLPALYTGAFVFVFPSEYEGFGLPVLEAMACDTPVSCSQTSSLPEVVGDAALMFDPTSVDVIAETLQRLIEDDDLRHELQQRASARAKLFSWERTSSKTLQQYRKIIRG